MLKSRPTFSGYNAVADDRAGSIYIRLD